MLDPNRLCQVGRDAESNTQLNTERQGEEVSSEWAAALPHLLVRRGGIFPQPSSNSVSYVSEDYSRRPSCDSAMSEFGNRRNSNSDLDRHEPKRYFFVLICVILDAFSLVWATGLNWNHIGTQIEPKPLLIPNTRRVRVYMSSDVKVGSHTTL